jgi:hypothetical protein
LPQAEPALRLKVYNIETEPKIGAHKTTKNGKIDRFLIKKIKFQILEKIKNQTILPIYQSVYRPVFY